MKRLITILLLAISGLASAQTYQLNYPDIRIGNSNTAKIVLRGSNIQFPFLALGSTTDSVVTIVDGVFKKVPRSQFTGGGGGSVTSVFGRTGVVTAQLSDYSPFYPSLSGSYNNPSWITGLDYSKIANVPNFLLSSVAASTYEPIFSKNTGFNKNFGTTAGTVAEGNDSRILNGQTAFGWGNHATAGYALDANVVHKTGNESIFGQKIWNDGAIIKGYAYSPYRGDAQLAVSNELGGHALIALENHKVAGDEEAAITYQAVLSNGTSVVQTTAGYSRFVDDDNTVGNYRTVYGVHLPDAFGDKNPFQLYSNNSVMLNGGNTADKPWDYLPPNNWTMVFGRLWLQKDSAKLVSNPILRKYQPLVLDTVSGTVGRAQIDLDYVLNSGNTSSAMMQLKGTAANPTTGTGLELGYSTGGGTAFVQGFNRDLNVKTPLVLNDAIGINANRTAEYKFNVRGLYTSSSLIDKGYADSLKNTITLQSATTNGSTTNQTILSNTIVGFKNIGLSGNNAYNQIDQTGNTGGKLWRYGNTGVSNFGSYDIYNQTDNINALSISSSGVTTLLSAKVTTAPVNPTDVVRLMDLGGGGGSGTVTNVSSANSDISISSPTTTPILTVNSSTSGGANTIPKRDANGTINNTPTGSNTSINSNATSGVGILTQATSGIGISSIASTGKAGRFETSGGTAQTLDIINTGTGDLINGISPNGLIFRVTNSGQISSSKLLTGTAGTDSILVHDNTTKLFKLVSPTYYSTSGGGGSYTAGYGLSLASTVFSADTTSSTGLVSKARLTASLGNFNVTSAFTGTGTVASPFDLALVTSARGGTGVNNGGSTITLGGNLTTSGAFATTLTSTAATNVTLPTSGRLYSTASGSTTSAELATTLTNETGTGNVVFSASPTLTGTPLSTTATAKTNTTQIATTAFVGKQFTATASGTGAATTITFAHGVSGVTSANSVIVMANNAAAGGIIYATMDATNVSVVYSVAPATGTNNLLYSVSIR